MFVSDSSKLVNVKRINQSYQLSHLYDFTFSSSSDFLLLSSGEVSGLGLGFLGSGEAVFPQRRDKCQLNLTFCEATSAHGNVSLLWLQRTCIFVDEDAETGTSGGGWGACYVTTIIDGTN